MGEPEGIVRNKVDGVEVDDEPEEPEHQVVDEAKLQHQVEEGESRLPKIPDDRVNGKKDPDQGKGEDNLGYYKVPDAKYFKQVFCKTCGSKMPRLDSNRGIAVIPFGSLDDDPGVKAERHIYVDDMAKWYQITDDLPQFGEEP